MSEAQERAGAILGKAGVEVEWVDCHRPANAAVCTTQADRLFLTIVTEDNRQIFGEDVLGRSMPGDRGSPGAPTEPVEAKTLLLIYSNFLFHGHRGTPSFPPVIVKSRRERARRVALRTPDWYNEPSCRVWARRGPSVREGRPFLSAVIVLSTEQTKKHWGYTNGLVPNGNLDRQS